MAERDMELRETRAIHLVFATDLVGVNRSCVLQFCATVSFMYLLVYC